MTGTVKLDMSDDLAVVTLNRPEAMNAFTIEMGGELIDALDQTDANPKVHAVVFTGAGKAFCAGADLSMGAEAFSAMTQAKDDGGLDDTDPKWRDWGGRVNLRIFDSAKPVVGALNGAAVGIGATMSFPMDARVGLKGAKMAIPFSKRGIAWDGCASWFLPRIVGINTAVDWGLSGRTFLADEAFEKGLLTNLEETPEAVFETAVAKARGLIANTAPVSVSMNRRLLWRMLGAPHPMDAHRLESRAILHRGLGSDVAEGVNSFLEKRAPEFPGQVPQDFPPGWPWDEDPSY